MTGWPLAYGINLDYRLIHDLNFHNCCIHYFCCNFFLFYNRDLQSSITNLLEDIENERSKHEKKRTLTKPILPSNRTNHKVKSRDEKQWKQDTSNNGDKASYAAKDLGKRDETKDNYVLKKDKSTITVSVIDSSTTLSTNYTNSSISTLKTYDDIDFQNNLIHLETKIDVIGDALKQKKNYQT